MLTARCSHSLALLGVVLVAAGCGSQSRSSVERVHFRASDGVLLDGRLFGRGNKGVVLVHMGRPEDTQADWAGLARLLADKGFLVLTYDRRGVCLQRGTGCSKGFDSYEQSWRDIVGAAGYLRGKGVEKMVVAGASIGAMATLYAASEGRIRPGRSSSSPGSTTRAGTASIGGKSTASPGGSSSSLPAGTSTAGAGRRGSGSAGPLRRSGLSSSRDPTTEPTC